MVQPPSPDRTYSSIKSLQASRVYKASKACCWTSAARIAGPLTRKSLSEGSAANSPTASLTLVVPLSMSRAFGRQTKDRRSNELKFALAASHALKVEHVVHFKAFSAYKRKHSCDCTIRFSTCYSICRHCSLVQVLPHPSVPLGPFLTRENKAMRELLNLFSEFIFLEPEVRINEGVVVAAHGGQQCAVQALPYAPRPYSNETTINVFTSFGKCLCSLTAHQNRQVLPEGCLKKSFQTPLCRVQHRV